jgi:predicted  nucleic acid-binding Zn-ribbon protein
MYKLQISRILAWIFLTMAIAVSGLAQTSEGRPSDEYDRNATAAAGDQIDIDAVARAEQRAEALRTQLFELEMRKLELQARIDDLVYQMTPDRIQRALALVGSARPMDELRNALRLRLESEKARLNKQLELLDSRRESLVELIRQADADVERLRRRVR